MCRSESLLGWDTVLWSCKRIALFSGDGTKTYFRMLQGEGSLWRGMWREGERKNTNVAGSRQELLYEGYIVLTILFLQLFSRFENSPNVERETKDTK